MTESLFNKLIVASLGLLIAYLAAVPAAAEQTGTPEVSVSFDGEISPRVLPRYRPAPVFLELRGAVHSTDDSPPPPLGRIEIAFGARGGLDITGLPVCPRARLRNATARQALTRCRGALVGRGEITTEVPLDPTEPLIARAGLLIFNGRSGCARSPNSGATELNEPPHARARRFMPVTPIWKTFEQRQGSRVRRTAPSPDAGVRPEDFRLSSVRPHGSGGDGATDSAKCHSRPAVWVHAYSASPPISFVLPFFLHRRTTGAYGVLMRSPVRRALGRWPRLRSFDITLGRRYLIGGELHSYLNGRCPLPPRFTALSVPVARATYHFAPGPVLVQPIRRRCRVLS